MLLYFCWSNTRFKCAGPHAAVSLSPAPKRLPNFRSTHTIFCKSPCARQQPTLGRIGSFYFFFAAFCHPTYFHCRFCNFYFIHFRFLQCTTTTWLLSVPMAPVSCLTKWMEPCSSRIDNEFTHTHIHTHAHKSNVGLGPPQWFVTEGSRLVWDSAVPKWPKTLVANEQCFDCPICIGAVDCLKERWSNKVSQ